MLRRCLITWCSILLWVGVAWSAVPPEMSPQRYPAVGKGCLSGECHSGHAPIRAHDSDMAKQIYMLGAAQGDPNGCVVCHGGDPVALWERRLHHGAPAESLLTEFTATPAAMSVVDKTCGQCHKGRVYNLRRSGMATGTGHISAILQGWGIKPEQPVGVATILDFDGALPSVGTPEYQAYMIGLDQRQNGIFAERIVAVPEQNWSDIETNPALAGYKYVRSECTSCHIGTLNNGEKGSGCAACHLRYGEDKKVVTHSLQGTRKSKVVVDGKTTTGIALESCAQCHSEGKRIATSYAGLLHLPELRKYRAMRDDVHHNGMNRYGNPLGGLLCQDCHSTRAMHGTGNIALSGRVNVEIECSDCHGTTDKFPWELPVGWQDEFGSVLVQDDTRGTAEILPFEQQVGTVYRSEGGYLLTARGNPFGNVIRRGQAVVVHSASGRSYEVPLLKSIAQRYAWKTPARAIAAKISHPKHFESLECYSCHSAWAPQEYGTHLLVDFKPSDVLYTARRTEQLQWRNPVLGINGEGRVSPLIPLQQQDVTLVAPDDAVLLRRHIFNAHTAQKNSTTIYNALYKSIEDLLVHRVDTSREETALSVYDSASAYAEQTVPLRNLLSTSFTMTPLAPHTVTRNARPCESCHVSSKALGYGDDSGFGVASAPLKESWLQAALRSGSQTEILDRESARRMVSRRSGHISAPQVPYTQLVTRKGKQLQQVGFHWELSSPLSEAQRDIMEEQNPFARLRTGSNVTEGTIMVVGKYEIDAIAASAAILGIILFVIVSAFMYTRRGRDKNDPN
ncbi:hypothetical protein [Halodesulfovibrio marinisediminis]|uniref:Cytochrome c554 and c-prime n=1 Tax=Halodesulfovibrio marinisediminis DSM 17456 TaxID=1121457 RepID=A0A1N6J3I2_9BACT|nr:hypothetical protein [Halodesulfovibrio marinisediminis]SIO38827.1 hypothetical protein SAMN02745161_3118 [Halodesulfovibrio marinisediminis DSM 17456]